MKGSVEDAASSPSTNKKRGGAHKKLSVGNGGVLVILDNDVEKVLDNHMAKNPRLRDFFEGMWENYDFKTFLEGFTAFYDELQKIGFSDNQKDFIFTKAEIIGWDRKSKEDKSLLFKEAKREIKEEQKKPKGKNEEETKFKRKAFFEKNEKLYLEILTTEEQYKYAYLNDSGNVELIDFVDETLPVELPSTTEGELAFIVKMPNESIVHTKLLPPAELLEKIKKHIKKYCDLPILDIELCTFYALFTWFYKKSNTTGYLRFLADTGKGKSRMLTVVGDLCFYPTSVAGSGSFSGMMRTNEYWHGTLMIDEADMKGDKESQTVKFLNLGFEAGKYFILSDKKDPSRQDVFDPFGPKILSMREPFKDNATEGRLLSISPHETTNDDIPIILDNGYYEKTQILRNEIARFVLEHWREIDGEEMLSFKGVGIEPRLQQLAMPLSIIFQLWDGGKEKFKAYITQRQQQLKRDRAHSWHGTIFNLVYSIANGDEELTDYPSYYNDGEIEAITPSMIAKSMNTSAKTVTDTLRSIGMEVELRYIDSYIRNDDGTVIPKKKRVRSYVVPDEKTWQEIIQRYHYDEDNGTDGTLTLTHSKKLEIPNVLCSKKFTSVPVTVPSVLTVPKTEVCDRETERRSRDQVEFLSDDFAEEESNQ